VDELPLSYTSRKFADQERQLRYELNRLRFEHDGWQNRRVQMLSNFWRWLPKNRKIIKEIDLYLDNIEKDIIDVKKKMHDLQEIK
jgi:hypothetical protein